MKTSLIALALACAATLLLPESVLAQADAKKPDAKKAAGQVQNVSVSEAAKLVADKKVVVLDIRTPDEFKGGHIAGAKNIDFLSDDFEKQLSALDRSQSYLVHCAAGGRSGNSLDAFKKLQFKSIFHLKDGFNGWNKQGKPVAKP